MGASGTRIQVDGLEDLAGPAGSGGDDGIEADDGGETKTEVRPSSSAGSGSSGGSGPGGFRRREHRWLDETGKLVFVHVKYAPGKWAYRHKVAKRDLASAHGPVRYCPEHEGTRLRGAWCPRLPAAADNLMWNMAALIPVLGDPHGTVLWLAGERDAETAQRYADRLPGHTVATTVHQGESRTATLTEGQRALLGGAECSFRIYYDRDETGIRNALARADALLELGITRVVLRKLPGQFLQDDEPADSAWADVNDVSDLFAAKGTLAQCETVDYDDLAAVIPEGDREDAPEIAPRTLRARRRRDGTASGIEDYPPRVRALLEAVRAVRPDAQIVTTGGKPHISCPMPDHEDRNPSFAVTAGRSGGLLVTCTCDTSRERGADRWPWLDKMCETLGITRTWVAPLAELPRNDDTRAQVFAALNRGRLVHVRELGTWLAWNGRNWAPDDERVTEAVRELSDELHVAAETLADDKAALAMHAFAVATGNAPKMRDFLSLAAQDGSLSVSLAQLDANPRVLVTPNAVIELGDARVSSREHRASDLCRLVTRARWAPDARSQRWELFLDDCQPERPTRAFLQKVAGYALLGRNPERLLVFITGPTSTGKTTFMNLIMDALGSGLAGTFQLSMFRTKRDDAPRPDILKAMPRRVIVAEEGSSEWNLHADVIKAMTSGGRIEARAMRSNQYAERTPAFTPFIATNEWPEVKHADAAVKRRIIGIPFRHQIARGSDDTMLATRFTDDDYAAILAWMVRGYEMYLADGLDVTDAPGAVELVTAEIHSSLSPVDQFIDECCELDEGYRVPSVVLYEAFRQWWDDCGKHGDPQNRNVFGREITERTGTVPTNPLMSASGKVRYRTGIRLTK